MNNICKTIIEIVNNNIQETEIMTDQIDRDLSELGMDSISFIRIVVALEEIFNIEIPDEYLLFTAMNTVVKMVDVVTEEIEKGAK